MKEKLTLLTIENDAFVRRSVRTFFEDSGFEVLEAGDGALGLSLFREKKPHVVLVDLGMPAINGLEVVDRLAAESPETPVVVLSGTGKISDAMDAIRRGAWDFVTKPITDMGELEHVVTGAIERSALREENRRYREHLEEEVAHRTRELKELNDRMKAIVHSTRSITTCASLRDLSRQLLKEFALNMASDGGSLYLLEGEHLVLKHSLDPGHAPVSIPLPMLRSSVFGRVLKKKTPILFRDIQDEKSAMPSGWTEYKNGSLIAFPLFDANGEVLGIVALHNKTHPPFTDQDRELGAILASYSGEAIKAAQAVESLRVSEEKYRELVENMNDAVYTVNQDGKISYVSPVMEMMTGYARSELLGMDCKLIFRGREASRMERAFQELMRGESTSNEYVLRKKSGELMWVRTSSRPIRKRDQVMGFQGVLMDVTESKIAEQRLETKAGELAILNSLGKEIGSNLSVQSAVKTAMDHIFHAIAPDFSILFLKEGDSLILKGFKPENNSVLEEEIPIHRVGECLCGLAVQETRSVYSVDIHSDPRCTFTECKMAGFRSFAALPLMAGDGMIGVLGAASRVKREFQSVAPFLEALSGEIAIGLKNAILYEKAQRDAAELTRRLTKIHESEEEKRLLTGQLQQTQKMEAIGTLAGGIAHDFNNILGGLLGYTELAMSVTSDGDERLNGYLNKVLSAGNRAKDLVQQILQFSRRDKNAMCGLSVKPILKESVKLMRSTLPSYIEIRESLRAKNDCMVGDATQIHQIIMNLCTNAYHAMHDGGVLAISLENETFHEPREFMSLKVPPGEYMKLSVVDTGHGIPMNIQARIFEPYFTTKKAKEGTGLGLAVVLGIIKSHNGLMHVESTPGQGSRFDVYFPITDTLPTARVDGQQDSPTGSGEKILIVDDEEFFLDVLRQHLEGLGYRVTASHSSWRLLEIIKEKPKDFDLVITDQAMPEMTGVQLVSEIRKLNRDVPVILCTGYSETVSEQTIKHYRINKFLLKPISRRDLAWAVHEVLGIEESKRCPTSHQRK